MTEVQIPLTGAMPAYVAVPPGEGPWPGVVVLSDVMGMTSDLRNQADWLASAGYLAVAPDLFFRGNKVMCLRTIFRDALAGQGQTFDDIEAARAWLAGRGDCTGRVGVIGFCMGGGFALQVVVDHGFSVASTNYGGIPKGFDTFLAGACPIIGSYGAKDRSLRGTAAKLELALTRAGVHHDVKEYPEAGHSFLNDHDPAEFNPVVVWLARLSNSEFHEPSAADARRRILAFFEQYLAGDQP
jgi:carboxymethylenebutenolidase